MTILNYDLTESPFESFKTWYEQAGQHDTHTDAFSLATCGNDRRPSCRYLLLKGHGEDGYQFYTNRESLKGRQISDNPFGEMTFFWRNWGRQIRISGKIEAINRDQTRALYAKRARESKLATAISKQGQKLESRDVLLKAYEKANRELSDEQLQLPDHWEGYRLIPDCFVFFVYGDHRLNERFSFELIDGKWSHSLLYP